MKFTIPKGKHYSKPKKIKLHFGKWPLTIEKTIKFNSSAKYDLKSVDQLDFNKLFGVSIGLHHKNSARFAWRWNASKNKVEIYSYVYDNKVRKTQHLEDINLEHEYTFQLSWTNEGIIFSVWPAKYGTNGIDGIIPVIYVPMVKKYRFGYYLWPYFGGNVAAPHNIEIEMR